MALKMKVGTGYMDLCSLVGPNICHKPDMCGFLRTVSKECPTIVKAHGNNCTCPIKKVRSKLKTDTHLLTYQLLCNSCISTDITLSHIHINLHQITLKYGNSLYERPRSADTFRLRGIEV